MQFRERDKPVVEPALFKFGMLAKQLAADRPAGPVVLVVNPSLHAKPPERLAYGVESVPERIGEVFDLQENVIDDILQSVQQQQALEEAPRALDPLQQTVATALQQYINHPDIERPRIIEAIRFLGEPFRKPAIRELRRVYEAFRAGAGSPVELVGGVDRLRAELEGEEA